jgi:hypothetical protein
MRYRETFIIKHGERLILKGVDPAGKGHHESEPAAKDEIEHYRSQLAQLQSLLYAVKKRSRPGSGPGSFEPGRLYRSRTPRFRRGFPRSSPEFVKSLDRGSRPGEDPRLHGHMDAFTEVVNPGSNHEHDCHD